MDMRIGRVLIEQGLLTEQQSLAVLSEQERTGEPFGLLCERLFNLDPAVVEDAWATQYASQSRLVDPLQEQVDRSTLELITRRQAWQFRVLPLRMDGQELMVATTRSHLRRALRFATGIISVPVFLVLASPETLGEALCRYYPLPGMTPQSVDDNMMNRLLA